MHPRMLCPIHGRLHIVTLDGTNAERMAQCMLKKKHLVVFIASKSEEYPVHAAPRDCFDPSSLIEIYKFDEMVNTIARRNPDQMLVFSVGSETETQARAAFLIGCHLIMSSCLDPDEVRRVFQWSDGNLGPTARVCNTIFGCWRALHHAKALAWIDFRDRFGRVCDDSMTIDMAELMHYSRCAQPLLTYNPLLTQAYANSPLNGMVVTLIPDQLLVFEAPDDATVAAAGERDFVDIAGRRHFSSAFYADLLADLGVALVVNFDSDDEEHTQASGGNGGDGDGASRAAFADAGLEYCNLHDLGGVPGAGVSLQSLDRLLTLASCCPGLIAVPQRGGAASGVAAAHLAALLVRQHSFAATAEAMAWVRMARPGHFAAAGLVERPSAQAAADGPGGRAWRRSLSLCGRVDGGDRKSVV